MTAKRSPMEVWGSVAHSGTTRSRDHMLVLDMVARILPKTKGYYDIGSLSTPDIAQVLLLMVNQGYTPEDAFNRLWTAGKDWYGEPSSFDSEALKMLLHTRPADHAAAWAATILSEPAFDLSSLKPEDLDSISHANTLIRLLRSDKVSRQVKLAIIENEQSRLKPRNNVLRAADTALPGYRIQSII